MNEEFPHITTPQSAVIYFESALKVIGTAIGLVSVAGVLYEVWTRKSRVIKDTILDVDTRDCKARML